MTKSEILRAAYNNTKRYSMYQMSFEKEIKQGQFFNKWNKAMDDIENTSLEECNEILELSKKLVLMY